MKKMKYFKINIVLLLLLLYIIPCYAYDFYVGGVYYYITSNENKTVRVTFSDKPYHTYDYSGDINIPSEVSYNGITYTVTAIGYQAFNECINLTSVNLPKTITSIGNDAFKNTNSLSTIYCQAVNPPDICSDTFDNFNITIVVPNVSLEAYKKANYWRYFNNIIPFFDFEYNGVYYKIKNDTEKIVEVTYKDTGYSSYSDSISIPNQVLYNGNNYEVKFIGQSAFRNSTHLKSVVIPNSITAIDSYAFYNCLELMNITCYAATPPSLQSSSFNSYNATVKVPKVYLNAYKSSYIWKNFNNLVSIYSYDFEQNGVFYNINSLSDKTVEVTYKDANYNSYSGVINIPSTATYNNIVYNIVCIGDSAFYKSANLTNVHIPSSVLTLGHSCFEDCRSITSIDIPSSVSTIASNALKGCFSLDTLVFNAISCGNFNSSTTNHQFNNLNISTIIIGNEVQRIPDYFANSLNNLKNVSIGNSVTYIGDNSFNECI